MRRPVGPHSGTAAFAVGSLLRLHLGGPAADRSGMKKRRRREYRVRAGPGIPTAWRRWHGAYEQTGVGVERTPFLAAGIYYDGKPRPAM